MGEAVGKVAGDALLDQQRAELRKQSMILANELASERESKGRTEAHGYAMETQGKQQGFQAGENKTDRENRASALPTSRPAHRLLSPTSASKGVRSNT